MSLSHHQRASWPLLASYSLGVLLAGNGLRLPGAFILWPLLLWSMALFLRRGRPIVYLSGSTLLFIFLGQLLYHQAVAPSFAPLPPVEQQFTAQVLRLDAQPQRWRMDVRLETPVPLAGEIVRLHLLDSHCPLLPGDRFSWHGKIRKPRRFGTPGEFDYPLYLNDSGIFATGYIPETTRIEHLEASANVSPSVQVERWRSLLGQKIAASIDYPQTPFLISLVLGEKSRLNGDQRQQLARFGLSHLFAISGLHLGLLAMFFYFVLQYLYRHSTRALLWCPLQQAVPFLTLPPLFFYLVLSGGALPTWRAGLLIALVAWLNMRHRQVRAEDLLSSIALFILLVKPLALFGASFQLSFAGVTALILVMPRWQHWQQQRWQRWLTLPALVSLTATLATLPIALWHFHLLAPAAVINNIFAVPLIGLVTLPLTLIATVLLSLELPGVTLLFAAAANVLDGTLAAANTLSRGMLSARPLYLTISQHIIIGGICLCLLLLLARHHRQALCGIAMTLLVALIVFLLVPLPSGLQLTTLSVGQGDSLLLQHADGTTYLIDGGGLYSETFDVGERLIAPALGRLGVDHLTAVILTHDHPDHRKGLVYILDHFSVDGFWCSAPLEQCHPSLQQVIQTKHIPVRCFSPGWTTVKNQAGRHMSVFVAPDADNKNDQSLVVYARDNNQGVLLCADLEKRGVDQLLHAPPSGPVDVIKLPHHASRHSTPTLLLSTLQPNWAIATVGYHNRYHFPHTEVLDAVGAIRATLIRTDRDGSVRLSGSNNGWQADRLTSPLPWP
nr:DNA internalization-related competence protein ComEC/Rec2 [uncultured Desulfuromonas sp.]